MSYYAKVLADSIAFGARLITLEVCHPRFILAEMNTHRKFSRNSASSRAIPVERRIAQVRENPFVPEAFSKNQRGMQAADVLDRLEAEHARDAWLRARDGAVRGAEALAEIGVHKQHANRLLEPFCWHTAVISSTSWENFFALRCHPAAQPEMQITAQLMREAIEESDPVELRLGEWHLPYVDYYVFDSEGSPNNNPERSLPLEEQRIRSVVRCAAVSYERQLAVRTAEQYRQRHDEMVRMGHWSPFEHQAFVCDTILHTSNFDAPWFQYRKRFEGEAVFKG